MLPVENPLRFVRQGSVQRNGIASAQQILKTHSLSTVQQKLLFRQVRVIGDDFEPEGVKQLETLFPIRPNPNRPTVLPTVR